MSEFRKLRNFKVKALDVEQIIAFSVLATCALVFVALLKGMGSREFGFVTLVGNSAGALFMFATLGLMFVAALNLKRFHALETTESGTLKCKYLLSSKEIPITGIQTIVLDEEEVEGVYTYVGFVFFKDKKLKSVTLDKFECLRLRLFFRHLESINRQIEFRENVNYLAMRLFP